MQDSWRWGRGRYRHNTPSFEILRDYSQSSEILRGYDNYKIISGNPRSFSKQISDSNFLKLALRAKNEAYGGIKRKILLFRLLPQDLFQSVSFLAYQTSMAATKSRYQQQISKQVYFLLSPVDPCACNVYLTTSSYSLRFSRTRVLFSQTTD